MDSETKGIIVFIIAVVVIFGFIMMCSYSTWKNKTGFYNNHGYIQVKYHGDDMWIKLEDVKFLKDANPEKE